MAYIISQDTVRFLSTMKTNLDRADIQHSLDIEQTDQPTFIVLAAVAKNAGINSLVPVPCPKGTAVSGYVYDESGCYRVSCSQYLRIGRVPFSYRLRVFKNVGDWNTFVPMPESVLLRHMTDDQRALVSQFKGTYGDSDFEYEYLQIVE